MTKDDFEFIEKVLKNAMDELSTRVSGVPTISCPHINQVIYHTNDAIKTCWGSKKAHSDNTELVELADDVIFGLAEVEDQMENVREINDGLRECLSEAFQSRKRALAFLEEIRKEMQMMNLPDA